MTTILTTIHQEIAVLESDIAPVETNKELIVFSNQVRFMINDQSKHNCRLWSESNPHYMEEAPHIVLKKLLYGQTFLIIAWWVIHH